MIKKIMIVLFFSGICTQLFSQLEYYDALALRKASKDGKNLNGKDSSIYPILDHYVPGPHNAVDEILKSFNKKASGADPNPFIEISGGSESETPNYSAKAGFSLASIGGLNVTNFADGLAQFMVERFKEELNVAFFEEFKNDMNKEEFSDLRILFPQTHRLLNTIDQNIYQYNIYMNTLRESFKNDLSNMYANADEVINQPKYQAYLALHPELRTIVSNSTYLINQYAKGVHPGDVLANYNPDTRIYFKDTVVQLDSRSAIKTMQLFSQSLRSKSAGHYWIGSDSLSLLLDDALTFKIYLGLLYQNEKTAAIRFSSGIKSLTLRQVLDTIAKTDDSLTKYKAFLGTFVNQAEEVDEYLGELKNKKKPDIDYNDYYKLFNSSIDLFEHAYTFIDLPYIDKVIPAPEKAKIRRQSEKGIFIARATGDLFIDMRTQNYSSGIINMLSIMDTVLSYTKYNYLDSLETKLSNIAGPFLKNLPKDKLGKEQVKALVALIEDYSVTSPGKNINTFGQEKSLGQMPDSIVTKAKEIITTRRSITTVKISSRTRAAILRYGSFMAAVVNAKNSEDVKNAIESVVLPSGSYSVKRETNFNVSVNSFIGPFGGAEYLPALRQNPWGTTTGFTAPVGIAFSWGNIGNGQRSGKANENPKEKKKGGQSFSLFVSVIDIGSVASFRLSNDSSKVSSEIQLKNIVSPGVYLYWGLPKCPVSIGIGGQLGPQLRQITAVSSNIDENYYIRFGFNVVVDIPLFNIYSKN